MELVFQQTQMEYLNCIVSRQLCQEHTGEAIVPDSSPDVEKIVDSFATVLVRSKDCQTGSVAATCGANIGVLYTAEGEVLPRLLTLYLPFNVRCEDDAIAPDSHASIQCCVRSIDARMLNPRKLMARVNVCVTVQVWNRASHSGYRIGDTPRGLQLRPAIYPMRLMAEYAEKQISLRDTIPGPQPACARILRAGAACDVTEHRVMGSRGVFKGNLRLQLLYESVEGEICCCDLPVPFSQYCEFGRDHEGEQLVLQPVFTALEVEPAPDHMLDIEIGVNMQCGVLCTMELPVLEDAYSTIGRLDAEWCEYDLKPQLDQRLLQHSIHQQIPAQAHSILDAIAWADLPEVTQQDGLCTIQVPVTVNVLYQDTDGIYQPATARYTAQLEVAAEHACTAAAWVDGQVFAAPGAQGIELRIPLAVQCIWHDERKYRSICGGTMEPEEGKTERPDVIIRTMQEDTDMWDIAKELHTTVSAIQIANDMEEDFVSAGTMLLIPIVA